MEVKIIDWIDYLEFKNKSKEEVNSIIVNLFLKLVQDRKIFDGVTFTNKRLESIKKKINKYSKYIQQTLEAERNIVKEISQLEEVNNIKREKLLEKISSV